MTRAERAAWIDRRLAELYPETPVPLVHHDAYTLLVAVLLSAQCTDKRVNEVTPRLFARAANPWAMVEVPVAEIQALIRPCG
ncbi:MAG: endonuclease III, partial [Verrucomicrobia bacterium]|nr:endonuclease III [Verrucomicrobiota bacterium]